MLRAAVALLLIANLVVFAWARGWLAPALQPPLHAEREPERVAAQVRPEAVTVLAPRAASAALSAAQAAAVVCLQAGPIAEPDMAAAEAALQAAVAPATGAAASAAPAWSREPVAPPAPWLVAIVRLADPVQRSAREDALRALGIAFEPLSAPADGAPGLLLSRHADRAAADAAAAALRAAGATQPGGLLPLRGLRVVAQPAPPPRHWLRVPAADAELQARLRALALPALAGGFQPCAARP